MNLAERGGAPACLVLILTIMIYENIIIKTNDIEWKEKNAFASTLINTSASAFRSIYISLCILQIHNII